MNICEGTYYFFSVLYYFLSFILWAITAGAAVFAARIYQGQKRIMDQSLKDQNLAWLIRYLQSQDVRDARCFVFNTLKGKKAKWSKDDKNHAATACAAYGVAGVLAKQGKVEIDIIVENWGRSIIDVCEVCKKFIDEMREDKPGYWEALLWLEKEARSFLKD